MGSADTPTTGLSPQEIELQERLDRVRAKSRQKAKRDLEAALRRGDFELASRNDGQYAIRRLESERLAACR